MLGHVDVESHAISAANDALEKGNGRLDGEALLDQAILYVVERKGVINVGIYGGISSDDCNTLHFFLY